MIDKYKLYVVRVYKMVLGELLGLNLVPVNAKHSLYSWATHQVQCGSLIKEYLV
jgi:hypothetical protein